MKILVLSCATGGGHNAAGRGISDALQDMGHSVDFRGDYLTLAGKKTEKTVCGLYVNSVTFCPGIFRAVYHIGRAVSTFNHIFHIKSPVYYVNGLMSRYLRQVIDGGGYDAVVMPHLFPAETLTKMKNDGCILPLTVAVATDYTSIPFWEETDCDYYIVPHSDCVADFVKRGIDRNKIIPLGIPAPREYTSGKPNVSCAGDKAGHKTPAGTGRGRNILIMGGSMGAGRLPQLIRALQREIVKNNMTDVNIIVVCGRNKKLYKKLMIYRRRYNNVTVVKYTNNVADYMRICDLLFTKPGGLTSTESAIMRIPTVFMDPISDCEKANCEAFVKYGMAIAPPDIDSMASEGIELLQSERLKQDMKNAQSRVIEDNCASGFVKILERLVKDNA